MNQGIEKTLYVKDFIQIEILNGIEKILDTTPYLCFPLICIGIEFLGKCIDVNCKFSDIKYNHFDDCIKNLMPKYLHITSGNISLKSCLRNGFAHQFRPKRGFTLCPIDSKNKNLSELKDGTIAIHLKDFFEDFKDACKQVIGKIENKQFRNSKDKVYGIYTKIKKDTF